MSTISASTTTTTAYKVTADTTGTLVLQTGSTPTTAVTVGTDQSVAFAGATAHTGLATFSKGSSSGITIGDVSTNSNSVLRLQGTSAGYNWQIANNLNVGGIEFTPSTATGGTTYTTPAMALTTTGLGIGTSSPTQKLTVVGNIKAGYDANTGVNFGLVGSVPASDNNSYILWGTDTVFGGTNGDLIYIPRTSTTASHRFYTGSGTPSEKVRITAAGDLLVGTTSVGTMSGSAVERLGNTGIISRTSNSLASGSAINIVVSSGGASFAGFLIVENVVLANALVRTQTTYSVFGRGTTFTATSIASANGGSGGASFTVTCPSTGVISLTNTSGNTTFANMSFFGSEGG